MHQRRSVDADPYLLPVLCRVHLPLGADAVESTVFVNLKRRGASAWLPLGDQTMCALGPRDIMPKVLAQRCSVDGIDARRNEIVRETAREPWAKVEREVMPDHTHDCVEVDQPLLRRHGGGGSLCGHPAEHGTLEQHGSVPPPLSARYCCASAWCQAGV